MLDVITAVQKELTLSIELNGLGWLVDTVCALEVFLGTLSKFSLSCVDNFVQVVDLTELALRNLAHHSTLARSKQESGSGSASH